MKIYIAAYQSKAYDIQNTNIMIKKISNRLGEELEGNLIFWEKSTLIVKLTSHCAAEINNYSLIPTRAYEFALFYSKSKCQRKTHQNFNSNKPGWTNRCVASRICHDEQSRRQTYPFHVKDQHWTRCYVIIFCQRPRCLVCHPEVLMQNLNYFRNYRLFSVKNAILDFNKKKGTGKRLFLNFTPLYLSEKQWARAFFQLC